MERVSVEIILGFIGGVLSVLSVPQGFLRSILPQLNSGLFPFYLTGWLLGTGLALGLLLGAIIAYKGRIHLGGYIMLALSLFSIGAFPITAIARAPITSIMVGLGAALHSLPGTFFSLASGILLLKSTRKTKGTVG